MPETARRVIFPEVNKAVWETVDLPDTVGPTEVLVRAVRTLVSAGTEIAIYSGAHIGYRTPGARYPRLPFRPGYAFAGIVEAVGADVTAYKQGDRVTGGMNHQDFVVVDTARSDMNLIPDGVSFEQACLARLSVISLQGVRLSHIALGEHVAVFGQGLIGQLARQYALISGAASIIAVDMIDARLEVARSHGATHVVNPSRDDLAATIAAATGDRGVDVAIEATGNPSVTNDALQVVARMGRVVLLGSPRGRLEIDIYRDVHGKGVSLIGAHNNTTPASGNAFHRWTQSEHRQLALELMRQGRLHADGLLSHHIPAAEALPIWDALTHHQQDYLGVIIVWE